MLRSSVVFRRAAMAATAAAGTPTPPQYSFISAAARTGTKSTTTSVVGTAVTEIGGRRWQSSVSTQEQSSIWPLNSSSQYNYKQKLSNEEIALVGGLRISQMKEENKHVSVVRYEHKNRTWTVHHVDYFSIALAIGFLDAGFLPGDVVLSCMPEHWSESMVLQFACSKAGMILYQLDHRTAKTDPDAFKESLKQALILTKANIYCSPETHDDVNYIELDKKVIPELTAFLRSEGLPFISPRYPHLRYCIQTGLNDDGGQEGFTRMHHFLVPAGTVEEWLQKAEREPTTTHPMTPILPSTPLMGTLELNDRGIPIGVGPSLSNAQVIQEGAWETYCKILKKEYHEVPGVGVVF